MSGIRFDMNGLQKGLEMLESKSDVAIRTFCDTGALKMQTYAQQNAPWTDRTGSARQRLQGGVEKRASGYAIRISHGVDYGIWLEVRHDFKGKYKILEEARDSQVDTFVSMMKALKL